MLLERNWMMSYTCVRTMTASSHPKFFVRHNLVKIRIITMRVEATKTITLMMMMVGPKFSSPPFGASPTLSMIQLYGRISML